MTEDGPRDLLRAVAAHVGDDRVVVARRQVRLESLYQLPDNLSLASVCILTLQLPAGASSTSSKEANSAA